MNSIEQNFITEEEAELYDRQIRLWGAGVQRSLRNTRVLVVGINGVAAEICKNLILSGVKSLTMMDAERVTKNDLASQYFLHPDNIGQNKAEASLKSAQILNPNVKVIADTSSLLDKQVSFYSNFDVVCCAQQAAAVLATLNAICKLYNVKFFCGDSFGMFGYLFEDLNDKNNKNPRNSFSAALNFNWTPRTILKRRKLEDPSYLLFKILMEFRDNIKRNPSRDFQITDKETLLHLRDLILKNFNVDGSILPLEYLDNVYGEYGPTCSIIGGMIAQEIVKSLSKDASAPYSIYFFNHVRCQMTGVMLDEGASHSAPKTDTMETESIEL